MLPIVSEFFNPFTKQTSLMAHAGAMAMTVKDFRQRVMIFLGLLYVISSIVVISFVSIAARIGYNTPMIIVIV